MPKRRENLKGEGEYPYRGGRVSNFKLGGKNRELRGGFFWRDAKV